MGDVFSIEGAAYYAWHMISSSFWWTGFQNNGAKTLWKRSPWRFRRSLYRFIVALVPGDFDPTHPYRRVYRIPDMSELSIEDLKYRVGVGTGDRIGRLTRVALSMGWVGGRPVFEYLVRRGERIVRIHPHFYRRLIRELWVTGELSRTRVEEILAYS